MDRDSYRKLLRHVAQCIRAAQRLLIATHEGPDGDGIGSALGIARALKKLGRAVVILVDEPGVYGFMAQPGELTRAAQVQGHFDCALCVDVGNKERVWMGGVPFPAQVINFDHHATNTCFGTLNLVDVEASATALIAFELIKELGVPLDAHIATPLLTGIMVDTGYFRFSNTTPRALGAAAELVAAGARPQEISEKLQERQPAYYRLLALVLATVQVEGEIITAAVTQQMLKETGVDMTETEGIVEELKRASGTRLAILFKELPDGTKLSLRSRGGVLASNIATALGGGGHPVAAGAKVPKPLPEARRLVMAEAAKELARAGR